MPSKRLTPSASRLQIISEMAEKTGYEKQLTEIVINAMLRTMQNTMVEGNNIYLRGFGTFKIQKFGQKVDNLSKFLGKTPVEIPAQMKIKGNDIAIYTN